MLISGFYCSAIARHVENPFGINSQSSEDNALEDRTLEASELALSNTSGFHRIDINLQAGYSESILNIHLPPETKFQNLTYLKYIEGC
jgi:hypothetical protein